MEFDLTIGISGHGRRADAEANSVCLLETFEAVCPGADPVVDADLMAEILSVTLSVEAENAELAIEAGRPVFARGAEASGLKPIEVVRIEVKPAGSEAVAPIHA